MEAILKLLDDVDDLIYAVAITVQPWLAPHPGRSIARVASVVVLTALLIPLSAWAFLA